MPEFSYPWFAVGVMLGASFMACALLLVVHAVFPQECRRNLCSAHDPKGGGDGAE